jgi:hypothetical protein
MQAPNLQSGRRTDAGIQPPGARRRLKPPLEIRSNATAEFVRIHIASVEFIPRHLGAGIQPPEAIRRLKPPLEIRSITTAESARIHIASVEFIPRHLGAGIHRPRPDGG